MTKDATTRTVELIAALAHSCSMIPLPLGKECAPRPGVVGTGIALSVSWDESSLPWHAGSSRGGPARPPLSLGIRQTHAPCTGATSVPIREFWAKEGCSFYTQKLREERPQLPARLFFGPGPDLPCPGNPWGWGPGPTARISRRASGDFRARYPSPVGGAVEMQHDGPWRFEMGPKPSWRETPMSQL